MNDLTRREFINTTAGGTIMCRVAFFHAATQGTTSAGSYTT
jgi:hypothetical protein